MILFKLLINFVYSIISISLLLKLSKRKSSKQKEGKNLKSNSYIKISNKNQDKKITCNLQLEGSQIQNKFFLITIATKILSNRLQSLIRNQIDQDLSLLQDLPNNSQLLKLAKIKKTKKIYVKK